MIRTMQSHIIAESLPEVVPPPLLELRLELQGHSVILLGQPGVLRVLLVGRLEPGAALTDLLREGVQVDLREEAEWGCGGARRVSVL